MKYDIGDMARFKAGFTANQTYGDPTAVKLMIKAPDGTLTEYEYGTDAEIIKESEGNYYCDFALTQKGTWWYRWEGTGIITAASEASINVEASEFYA